MSARNYVAIDVPVPTRERPLTAQEEFRQRHPMTEVDRRACKEILEQEKTRSVEKMKSRIERVKRLRESKRPPGLIWDTRRVRWVDPDSRAWWSEKESRMVHPGESAPREQGEKLVAKKEKAAKTKAPRKTAEVQTIRDRTVPAGKVADMVTIRDNTKQSQVLRMIDKGAHVDKIASTVGIPVSEVRNHITNLAKKGVGHVVEGGKVTAIYPTGRGIDDFIAKKEDKQAA